MIKLIIIIISSIMTAGAMHISDDNDLGKIYDFFSSNIETFTYEYNNEFDEKWDISSVDSVKRIYDFEDKIIGYLVDFDKGYIAFSTDYSLFKMDTEEKPDFYDSRNKLYYFCGSFLEKENNQYYFCTGEIYNQYLNVGCGLFKSAIYYEIESRINYKGFKIISSCTKIPVIKDIFDSSSWGNYKAVSVYQGGTSDCGVIAIMDLLYTFKLSGCTDYTKGKVPSQMREDLRDLTNWQGNIVGEGMLPMDLTRGCTNYINTNKVSLKATGNYRDDIPEICLYFDFNIADTSHFAMKVGSAQQDYWWVFKTKWDIIVSWDNNYSPSDGIPTNVLDVDYCYYLVDQQYRQGSYQLYNGSELVKM